MAIKMYVQLKESGSGFAEAMKMLVSGELIAREVFQQLFKKKDSDEEPFFKGRCGLDSTSIKFQEQ